MADPIQFEPGASVPLFVVLEDDDGVPIPDPAAATVRLSVLVKGREPVDIPGVLDPERGGFVFDLDLLGPVLTSKSAVKAVFYADWGDGWDRVNEEPLMLKPLEGAHWQAST